jgi:hypothetical protein
LANAEVLVAEPAGEEQGIEGVDVEFAERRCRAADAGGLGENGTLLGDSVCRWRGSRRRSADIGSKAAVQSAQPRGWMRMLTDREFAPSRRGRSRRERRRRLPWHFRVLPGFNSLRGHPQPRENAN